DRPHGDSRGHNQRRRGEASGSGERARSAQSPRGRSNRDREGALQDRKAAREAELGMNNVARAPRPRNRGSSRKSWARRPRHKEASETQMDLQGIRKTVNTKLTDEDRLGVRRSKTLNKSLKDAVKPR